MKASQNGINFIKAREGFRLTAYKDSAGIWTIGYGSIQFRDGSKPTAGMTITQAVADDLLAWEVGLKGDAVDQCIKTKVTQNQFDACVSLAYNIGINAFKGSTVLRLMNQNPNVPAISDAFLMWDKARVNGVLTVVPGLETRRKAEVILYFTK